MGMSLHEIEEKAQELAERLLDAGKQEALLLGIQLEGLRDLAQIIQVGDGRIAHNAGLELECAVPSPTTPGLTCQRNPGHPGKHGNAGVFWYEAEPTKPAADRLHGLVSYFIACSEHDFELSKTHTGGSVGNTKHLAVSKAYDDAATKLQDILQEGGI